MGCHGASGKKFSPILPMGSEQEWSKGLGEVAHDTLKSALGTKGAAKTMGDAMLSTNPYYNDDYREYSENCQRVVVAYEARRRGYDVTAQPTYKGDTLNRVAYSDDKAGVDRGRWMGAFQGANPVNVSSKKLGEAGEREVMSKINNQMAKYGEGSRGVVQIFYKGGGGHVFNVERKNGKTQWIEAQVGKVKDINNVMHSVRTGRVALVRTDNLKFSDRAKKFVTPAK